MLEPVKKRRPPEDDSFLGIRIGVLLLIAMLLFGILTFRLWFLQILSGDQYVAEAKNNRVRELVMEAPRGVIYDRNHQILVENRAGLSVGLLPMDMPHPEKQKEEFDAEVAKLAILLGLSEENILKAYEQAEKNPYVTYPIKEDVPESPIVTYLKEHRQEFPGVEVEKSYLRKYPFKALATHLVGYVGEVSEKDLDVQQFANLKGGASVGKSGVERTYDAQLRGTDGKKTVEVDAMGRPKRFLEDIPAKPGNNLVLTIDRELQQAAEEAILDGIRRAHEEGFTNAAGGAVVALDPNNGQVLAMASFPEYDPSLWVGGMSSAKWAELNDPTAHNPLLNRALSGLYPAGSTFKPFVAAAALDAGLVNADTIFNCTGKFSEAQQTWKCWQTDGHGDKNMVSAIAESCDVYFYNLGKLFYEQSSPVLQNGVRLFGFDKTTGIDLPGETTGSRVPDKVWKEAHGKTDIDKLWKTGDEINLAIGQGDLLVTPLQMAVALAALVNGGTVYVPHLGYQITDPSGNVIHQFQPEPRSELGINSEYLAVIQRGMRMVTSDYSGTAHETFRGFPVPVGGKTGTSEKLPEDDYALFMGYAPADSQPEIVVMAIIEQGGHGSAMAAPVVRKVMEAFFHTQSDAPITQTVTE